MSQHAANHTQSAEGVGRAGSADAQPLTRRRMTALLALGPIGLVLSACATTKSSEQRRQQPTYKNGKRGGGRG